MRFDMKFKICPLTLKQANDLVASMDTNYKPVVGHRFSIGIKNKDGKICGAAIIGRPIARNTPQYDWVEVTRIVADGSKKAYTKLYKASAKISKEMGFKRIQTFILENESDAALKSAEWDFDGISQGGDWNRPSRDGRRTDQPQGVKQRWKKELN